MNQTAAVTENQLSVDFKRIRDDFPILSRSVNDRPLVYLDNAASSQMPRQVADRLHRYHTEEHANVHRGIHTLSQVATDYFEEAREKVQRFINAPSKDEVILTYGTTDAINLVAYSMAEERFQEGDEIIISAMEHHSNIVPWQLVGKRTGASIKVIPMNDLGELDMDAYRELISEKTKLVSVMHVSNALGTINPVKEIIAEAHSKEIPVLIDGAQSAPHLNVDVQDLDADFYVFSGHKVCGPTGIGILYAKERWLEELPPFRGGGEMIDQVTFEETTFAGAPHKFEAGTPPIAAVIGLGAAIDYLSNIGMDAVAAREAELLDYATDKLRQMADIRFIGTAAEKASVISFMMGEIHPHDIGTILDQQGIAIRTGHHCAQPVMRRFDIPATARASFSFYNNEADIDRLIEGLNGVKELFG